MTTKTLMSSASELVRGSFSITRGGAREIFGRSCRSFTTEIDTMSHCKVLISYNVPKVSSPFVRTSDLRATDNPNNLFFMRGERDRF